MSTLLRGRDEPREEEGGGRGGPGRGGGRFVEGGEEEV